MVIQILFFVFFAAFITYGVFEHLRNRFEKSFARLIKMIVIDLRKGLNLRNSLSLHSKEKNPAEKFIAKVLETARTRSLGEAFKLHENYLESQLLICFSRIVQLTDDTKLNIIEPLTDLESDYSALRDKELSYQDENLMGARMIQVIGVFGIPTLVLFLNQILEVKVSTATIYFMGFIAILYGTFDYFMFSNWKKTILVVPLLFLGYVLVITGFSDWVAHIFLGMF